MPDEAREVMEKAHELARQTGNIEPGVGGTLKILLVDDEEDFVRTMAERLQMRDLGSDVALNGEDALSMLEEDLPDVMVLDLKMPGIGGLEVLEAVKSRYPTVQVIILTGHGSEKDEAIALRLGAFAYLKKPVDIQDLMAEVRRAGEAPSEDL